MYHKAAKTGVDIDNDGFLSQFDCDDNNALINPNAAEIIGNEIDENCDGLLSSISDTYQMDIQVGPNPSSGTLYINSKQNISIIADLYTVEGRLYRQATGVQSLVIREIEAGIYFLRTTQNGKTGPALKIIVQ